MLRTMLGVVDIVVGGITALVRVLASVLNQVRVILLRLRLDFDFIVFRSTRSQLTVKQNSSRSFIVEIWSLLAPVVLVSHVYHILCLYIA